MTGVQLCEDCPYAPAPGEAGRSAHERKLCGSRRHKRPGTCTQPAGWGTPYPGFGRCKIHGGLTPGHIRKAARAMAARAAATYGLPIRGTDPGQALLDLVDRAAGHVAWLGDMIRHQDPTALVWGLADETNRGSGEYPGLDRKLQAAPSVWLQLYQEERKHLAQVARDVIALRLEERGLVVREVIRRQGATLAMVTRETLRLLGFDPNDATASAAYSAAIRLVTTRPPPVLRAIAAPPTPLYDPSEGGG